MFSVLPTKPKKFRKDFGDIDGLANSIAKFGQFHEILKTKDGITIDGDRREAAFEQHLKKNPKSKIKKLRVHKLPFTYEQLEKDGAYALMQVEANTQRKNFTVEETEAIRVFIEKLRRAEKLPEEYQGKKTVQIVGELTDRGSRNIHKISDIVEAVKDKKLDKKYLTKIDKGDTTINTVHQMVTREERSLPKSEIPKGSYDCVLIDFPIKYDAGPGIRGSADSHYPTMTLEECMEQAKKLPIAKEAIIFLWITKPMLFDTQIIQKEDGGVELMGHTEELLLHSLDCVAKDHFVWVKQKMGLGTYTRSQHEILLVCFRGEFVPPAQAFSSVIQAEQGAHSDKPNLWPMIKKMYPGRKYFECYRRIIVDGVDGFGNQTREEKMTPIEKMRRKKK